MPQQKAKHGSKLLRWEYASAICRHGLGASAQRAQRRNAHTRSEAEAATQLRAVHSKKGGQPAQQAGRRGRVEAER